jgi:hypothetical protein
LNLSVGAIEFPTTEMQECTQSLSHIDLVLSQILVNVLHNLETSVTQEIQFHVESTSMELAKVTVDNETL